MAPSSQKAQSDLPHDPEETQARMSFGEHLEELRRRLFRAFGGALIGIVGCLYFAKEIVGIIVRPYRLAAIKHHLPDLFNTMKPQEGFLAYLTLAFQAGLVVSSPWIIYQLWQFIAAGLFPRERKIVYRYVGPSVLLFLLGVAFFYFIVLYMTLSFFIGFTDNTAGPAPTPTAIERMMGFGDSGVGADPTTLPAGDKAVLTTIPAVSSDPPEPPAGQATLYYQAVEGRIKLRAGKTIYTMLVAQEGSLFANIWRFDDYISFVTFTALIFGVAFELPMVMLVLAQVGIVETQTYRNIRKYAYFAILIVAAIAAPSGDPLTLMFMCIPLIGLYEVGILSARLVVGKPAKST